MPTLYQLKPRFQQSLRRLVDYAWRWGVTPNQITVTALLLSVATGLLMAWFHAYPVVFLAAPVVLLLRMALNAMDGMLARTYQMQTPLGAILNEVGDVVADAALYLPFAILDFVSPLLMVLIVLGAFCTEMTGVVAVQIGATRRYDGPLGKSDRALLFSLYALVIQWGQPQPLLLTFCAVGVLFLLVLTIFNRAYRALQEVKP
ncbi:MAG: CDP-alcohol phosphatidyltransferase family protein [Caldilinea sp. CFX5]|nr:CDP-alcohol phosphatidyltransferase family protein [Caldilinea sp. CFX5]